MDKKRQFLLQILIGELEYHIESAKKDYSSYLMVKKQLTGPKFINERFKDRKEMPSAGEVFRHLHSFLTHCVLICNLLLPIHKESKNVKNKNKREKINEANNRKTYRKKLLKEHIKKGGSLDSLRAIRNRFEHYDEDLDEWIATTKHTIYISRNIFSNTTLNKAIKISGVPEEELEDEIKPFAYIEDDDLKYWGKKYDIKKAYDTLVKLEQEVKDLNLSRRST